MNILTKIKNHFYPPLESTLFEEKTRLTSALLSANLELISLTCRIEQLKAQRNYVANFLKSLES